jgi:hypothetical protein
MVDMKDKELYAVEMDLIDTIGSKKASVWKRLLAIFELSALVDQH